MDYDLRAGTHAHALVSVYIVCGTPAATARRDEGKNLIENYDRAAICRL